ncbi:MAG: hydantoinase/oxoprolinase family protein [Candidatus Rokubacteria bacterium]|nr:hydantoinase/oxoprolinase family protein [Candidatus Rokubacteria bacterium]
MILVGIDVGGTFTDVTAVEEDTGAVRVTKVPSTPSDEGRAVLKGLAELAVAGPRVLRLVHGTTVGTNTILQQRGARVALVTTAGFRDLIEIGRTKRNIPALFNPTFVRPKPPVPRPLRFEVTERVLYDGSVLRPVNEAEVRHLSARMAREEPEAFAVCLLHSYANPAHERCVAELLRQAFPRVPVSCSSEVVPEYREFERFSTTVLNAYIQPLMERYLDALERELVASGYRTGVLTVGSSGGVLTAETAKRLPIKTIFSGPAGGVSQAVFVGRRAGLQDLITYDMGGTSTDVCLVRRLSPTIATDNLIAAFPVKTPQVDIKSVGAGGGSIAWVDVDGSLQVGPHSAGADPGPASYGLGGREATVTDANLLLGRISASRPLGGTIRLDPALAREAIERMAAKLAGLDLHRLAEGIIRIAVARMTASIREITIQRGHDPRDFTLLAFGGAGPMHAIPVAEELEITRILVPRHPGNFSALGLLASDIKHDAVRTRIGRLSEAGLGRLRRTFSEMKTDGAAELSEEGFAASDMRLHCSLDLRYLGQAFELAVPVDAETMTASGIASDFHRRHLETYGHADETGEVEVVNLRLTAWGLVPKPDFPPYRSETVTLGEARIEERPVYFNDSFLSCPVYQRERLPAGAGLSGPAIVEEFGATTVLFPGWTASLDPVGNLILELIRL